MSPSDSIGLSLPAKLLLNIGGDNDREWKLFKQRFQLYLLASEKEKKDESVKVALLLTAGGSDLLEIYNSFDFPTPAAGEADPAKVLQTVLEKFDEYFAPRKNELASRYKFRKCLQRADETVDSYITRLRILIKDCNYEEHRDKELRDQIVFGCSDDKLRKKFFEADALTLRKTMELCVAYQASKKQMDVYKEGAHSVETIQKVKQNSGTEVSDISTKFNKATLGASELSYSLSKKDRHKRDNIRERPRPIRKCKFCGQEHVWAKEKCPAYGKKCTMCNKMNHFAIRCKNKNVNYVDAKEKIVYLNHESDSDSSGNSVEYLLKVSSRKDKLINTNIEIEGRMVRFQVDCGASVNVIPFHYIPNATLMQCDTTLEVWTSSTIKPIGKCRLIIRNCKNRKRYSVEFIVVAEEYTPLLGKRTSEQMGLITVNYENISAMNVQDDVMSKYKDVFNKDMGTFKNNVHLTVDTSAEPMAIPSCRVPINLKDKVFEKLREMEKAKIIEKVDQPTDWVSRMVTAVKKTGDLRICIDPQALNKALKRELHPLPIIDDILPELSKAKVFSSFDLKNGYWHCTLDEESSLLTTFQTPFGRYKWLRLPFGLNVSSEIFQKRLHMALENIEGVVCIADDILVYGVGGTYEQAIKDHDHKLNKLLERCRQKGIKLNKDKIVLRKSEITFLGHKVTSEGSKVDPQKIEAITNMDAPTDVTGVQRLSGMVNYLSRFLPNLSDVMEPIRRLTHQGIEWDWTSEHNKAFSKVKKMITEAPILQYYDPNIDLVIQCDASQKGLGAVLLQGGRPITFASRALTDTETRYAQIEKETLAIVFALNKFHQYVFGKKIIIESDHKPLENIVVKPLCNAPKRLQGMLLNILQYDVKIIHKKGKEMYLADTLSRSFLPIKNHTEVEFEHINMVEYLPIRIERLNEIKIETENDDTLQMLKVMILKGWPDEHNEIPPVLKAYSHTKDEYTVQNGLIFKGNRIVIPNCLRKSIKDAVHSSHIGIEGCLRRARECVYWPGMNADLKEYISKCDMCNSYPSAQQKETLKPHEPTDRQWEKVGVDLMTLKNHDYIVTVDYFSNFWEIDFLENTRAATVIRKLKAHFARYGLPSVLISDNGPQFTSDEFKQFSVEYDFEHRTSSPTYPQSNGMAESAVKTAKRLIKKAVDSGRDPYLAILDYRNTPTQDKDASPAQYNLGRRTRTRLPMVSKLLEPQHVDAQFAKERKKLKNAKSKWYYDRGARDLESLSDDDNVRMKPSVIGKHNWERGKIVKRLDERSYLIESNDRLFRRNRVHLRKTADDAVQQNDEEEVTTNIEQTARTSPQTVEQTDIKDATNNEPLIQDRPVRNTRNKLPSKFNDFDMSQ